MRNWSHIIVHHSASSDHPTLDSAGIIQYHTKTKGWSDVGYHAMVEYVSGNVICLFGRPVTRPGSHTLGGWNTKGLGICFIGDYTHVAPPRRMLQVAVLRIIRPWMRTWDIPKANILGHRDVWATQCPGRSFDLQKLKELI